MKEVIALFSAADVAWQMELERVYGRDACNARYDNTKNGATPKLQTLRLARDAAQEVYNDAWAAFHAAQRNAR